MNDDNCLDCLNYEYCEHTSMGFCMVENMPAWMALDDLYDREKGMCSKFCSSVLKVKTDE